MTNLHKIIFEYINDDHSYGKYGDFKVILNTKNRYINATKLCSENNKRFDNWLKTDKSKELIKKVNEIIKSEKSKYNATILIKAGGGAINNLISGTYVHELIIPHVAQWISVDFAIMVSKIVNNHLVDKYIDELRNKDKTINEKEDSITKLQRTIARIEKKLDDANVKLDDANEKLDDQ